MVPVFKSVMERSRPKNYHTVSLFSVVSEVFENFVISRSVDYLKKCGPFSDIPYGCRSSGPNNCRSSDSCI